MSGYPPKKGEAAVIRGTKTGTKVIILGIGTAMWGIPRQYNFAHGISPQSARGNVFQILLAHGFVPENL